MRVLYIFNCCSGVALLLKILAFNNIEHQTCIHLLLNIMLSFAIVHTLIHLFIYNMAVVQVVTWLSLAGGSVNEGYVILYILVHVLV